MEGERAAKGKHEAEWQRSERISVRIALAIALVPIPIAVLISWALDDPPWKARPQGPADPPTNEAPAEPGHH